MKHLLLIAAMLCAPLPALAHKVIFSVYPSGDVIEGELGFSDGTMASEVTVEVFDAEGNKIGEAVTDEDGYLTYAPTAPGALSFRADLSAGHVGMAELSAEDVNHVLGIAREEASMTEPAPSAALSVASLSTEEKFAIAEAVRDEVRPLRREIAAYKEHNDLQTILGGIGYIIGLFGVGFYFAARRKLAA